MDVVNNARNPVNIDSLAYALRVQTPADEAFLRQLYAATRSEEMAYIPWPDAQKETFLNQQFDLQRRHFQIHHPYAEFMIVLMGGEPAGRFYLDRSGAAILLVDIALLPKYRNLGVGTQLLKQLQAEATAAAKPVRLHVEVASRAYTLYRRLDFISVEAHGIRWLMEWFPSGQPPKNRSQSTKETK